MPTLSIIIVNYQNWGLLDRCLNSLRQIDWIEVVVVDNCSPTNRLEEFQKTFPAFKFIKNTGNNGFANACNLGAKHASGLYYFFLNPDAVALDTLLDELLKQYQDLAILGVVQVNEKGKKQAFEKPFPSLMTILGWTRAIIAKKAFTRKIMLNDSVQQVPWVSGAAVFISKKWFDTIKGWDEDFWMYFEDTALSKKAIDLGGKVGILLNPTLLHLHGGSSRINPKTTALTKLEVMISRHVYIDKYVEQYRSLTQALAVANHLILGLFQTLIGLITFFTPKGRMYLRLFRDLVSYYIKAIGSNNWKSPRIA
ncbi:hypothetical protein SAMN06298216_2728 [Spirosomataceae bacterium TFI 002]|nr:hypothetical protein SAMN06298216_2728 [Spirosomataceae bacterium TFI 002]